MDWKTSDTPLEKTDQESVKAHAALVAYATLGADRSLAKLLARYQNDPGMLPTKRLKTLKDWSRSFAWQERIARFEAMQHDRELAEWVRRASELREREWKLTQNLMDKAEQMLKFPLAEIEKKTQTEHLPDGKTLIQHVQIFNPAKWFFADAAKLIQLASRVARLATGQETEHSKHTGEIRTVSVASDDLAEARKKAQAFEEQYKAE